MARPDPLLTVLKLAQEAEEQAALALRAAQLDLGKLKQQLDALNHYRLDYMRQIAAKEGTNIGASAYQQFHRFIKQIDQAIAQQVQAVQGADKQLAHRRQTWMERQQKRKAVELLLQHKADKREAVALRQEQKLADEFAMQQFIRRRS
ncbi:flagellar export protein FliJ [Shewanella khirikhana]|jgi:flagellar FliJ protein|uniref:Flagellar FliJ protein n=1 Tax=Shewanella khirikhana TaxID=1965282 RepID=A0ABM7DB91_9GAMM|nr:flagellar export protein FliJ [Shewanella khirikhana]AZQ11147.1 flagellar biosynthesis chaperone [Shewanella khirikhana]